MSEPPLLTVLIPTRHRPGYIYFLLKKLIPLLSGSNLSWEILVSENPVQRYADTETQRVVSETNDNRVRYHAHCPAFETGEENIFNALVHCRGVWVWTCADDDYPKNGALDVLTPLLIDDQADFILCNASIVDEQMRAVHPIALKEDIVGESLTPFEGNLVKFVRKSGFMGFLTTMSSALFKRSAVMAIDWKAYISASAIYSHSSIYLEAFANKRFIFVAHPLVNFLRGEDTESRWDRLAKAKGMGLRFPWTLGIVRHMALLEDRGVVPSGFMFDITEVNDTGRFLLSGHTAHMVIEQIVGGIELRDAAELYSHAESMELLSAFSAGPENVFKTLSAALAVNNAVSPFIRVLSARNSFDKPKVEDRRLADFMASLKQERFERVVENLRHSALYELLQLRRAISLNPPRVEYLRREGERGIFKVGTYTFAVAPGASPPETEHIPIPGDSIGLRTPGSRTVGVSRHERRR